MTVALLPCEIQHREFDAKLLLASNLASSYGISSLIGYDKYFSYFVKCLPPTILLDKSCSSIIWESRIKSVKNNGGSVVVSDEEGFNSITDSHPHTWLNRVDHECAESIDFYACWGKKDSSFYSQIPSLKNKLEIFGNIRSDLLGTNGKTFYSDEISALQTLFGNFIFCSDNFAVEHRYGDSFIPPNFNSSSEHYTKSYKEFLATKNQLKCKREIFAKYIYKAANDNPSMNFIVRPHPCSDDRWWNNYFWKLRNVFILYNLNVEPYLHAAKCCISMGCTTSLQSIISSTPVIEIVDQNKSTDLDSSTLGYAHNFTKLLPTSYSSFIDCINLAISTPKESFDNLSDLNLLWNDCFTCDAVDRLSSILSDYCPKWTMNDKAKFTSALQLFVRQNKLKPVPIDNTKWIVPSNYNVRKKLKSIEAAFNKKAVRFQQVLTGLYFISPV